MCLEAVQPLLAVIKDPRGDDDDVTKFARGNAAAAYLKIVGTFETPSDFLEACRQTLPINDPDETLRIVELIANVVHSPAASEEVARALREIQVEQVKSVTRRNLAYIVPGAETASLREIRRRSIKAVRQAGAPMSLESVMEAFECP